ncbi:hypothetical protein E4T43_02539 [Aureobasidium subglaciale]|nr:hypothetical protein E4T43_02539 [Aureobasidium subglaciale]
MRRYNTRSTASQPQLAMAPSPVQSSAQSRPKYTRSKLRAQAARIRAKGTRQQPIPTYDPSKPSFLDLPGEVRNLIYDLVVQDMPCAGTLNLYTFRIPTPSMALACKQILGEVMDYVVQDLRFRWTGDKSGGGFDFSVTQTPLLSVSTRVYLDACTAAGMHFSLRHLNFCAPCSHGTSPFSERYYWDLETANGKATVTTSRKDEGTDACVQIWQTNMEKGVMEIMQQHRTKSLGVAELVALRQLLSRFSLHGHFGARSTRPEALDSENAEMIRLKGEYLGCHLETHPWEFYQMSSD